jgi:hypothetical protein
VPLSFSVGRRPNVLPGVLTGAAAQGAVQGWKKERPAPAVATGVGPTWDSSPGTRNLHLPRSPALWRPVAVFRLPSDNKKGPAGGALPSLPMRALCDAPQRFDTEFLGARGQDAVHARRFSASVKCWPTGNTRFGPLRCSPWSAPCGGSCSGVPSSGRDSGTCCSYSCLVRWLLW